MSIADATVGDENRETMALAQSNSSPAEDKEKPPTASEAESTKSAEAGEKESSKEESKELKPFVPSEEIAGEQAVDFPVDI